MQREHSVVGVSLLKAAHTVTRLSFVVREARGSFLIHGELSVRPQISRDTLHAYQQQHPQFSELKENQPLVAEGFAG